MKSLLTEKGFNLGNSVTPITPLIVGDEALTIKFSEKLLKEGVYTSAIVFPTVPVNTARLRLMPTALHTKNQLEKAVEIIYNVAREMKIIS